jgi:hypothetical protein
LRLLLSLLALALVGCSTSVDRAFSGGPPMPTAWADAVEAVGASRCSDLTADFERPDGFGTVRIVGISVDDADAVDCVAVLASEQGFVDRVSNGLRADGWRVSEVDADGGVSFVKQTGRSCQTFSLSSALNLLPIKPAHHVTWLATVRNDCKSKA